METEPVQKPMSQKTRRRFSSNACRVSRRIGGLGYHAGASVKMGKLFIGNAERTDWKVRGLYVAVQGVCAALSGMADKQQAVGMFEVTGNRFLGCHPAYAFLFGIAEMLADV